MRARKLQMMVWTVVGLTLLGACGSDDEGAQGGTLSYGIRDDVVHFDPALLPAENFPMIPQLFNSIIQLDENVEPQPELASDWEFSDDQLELTLTIRDDVEFHDGTPMTAEDVVWSIDRYQNEETGANARVLLENIVSLEATDDTTVVLGFDEPQAAIFDGLDMVYVTKPDDPETIRTTPNGTGPFVLADYVPGDRLMLERNDAYWKDGLPVLDAVEMRVLPDDLGRAVSLETGEIMLMGTPPDDDLGRLAEEPGIEVLQASSPSVVRDLMINVTSGPFQDARVRQAVHHAIDRERIIDITRAGRSEAWCLPWHDGSIAFTPAARDCPRDLELARQLLAEAGYEDGFEMTLLSAASEEQVTVAQIVASNLEEIGIDATIEQGEAPDVRELSMAGDYEMRVHGYGRANRDPATLLTTTVVFRPADNWSQFRSDRYTQLVADIATTLDPDDRATLQSELNELMLEEMFVVNVAPSFLSYAFADGVSGLTLNLDGMPVLEEVSLS